MTPAAGVFKDSIHTAPRPKTGSPWKYVFCTAKHHVRCLSSRLGIDFDEIAQRFFVKLPTILWVQWWTRSSGLVGFAKLRTQCKSFGKPTKGVSCWLKVKIFLMQENSKSRMFNYNTCTVLLGCMWLPVSPELPERGGREPESCCCAGFVVTLGKLKSNQEKSIDCFLYNCMWLVICKNTHWPTINVGGSCHV